NKEAVASSIWLLFFLLECDSKLTHYHPNWLNFNSDNYPARGGLKQNDLELMFVCFWLGFRTSISSYFSLLKSCVGYLCGLFFPFQK
ncbi:hypothetical protein D8T43_22510, partial [Vibrio vulnificus]